MKGRNTKDENDGVGRVGIHRKGTNVRERRRKRINYDKKRKVLKGLGTKGVMGKNKVNGKEVVEWMAQIGIR